MDEEKNTNAIDSENIGSASEEPIVTPEAAAPVKPKKSWKKELREWVVSISVALFVVFVIRSFLFQIIRVDGKSMYDTLDNNERLFVTVLDVKLNGVERNDVVICHYPNRGNTNFVKRVVGVPGDTISRKDNVTSVTYGDTGETVVLDDPYAAQSMYYGSSGNDYSHLLEDDEYFVVGDNRFNSHDSRDWQDNDSSMDVGPIGSKMIIGRVRYVFWPIGNARAVE